MMTVFAEDSTEGKILTRQFLTIFYFLRGYRAHIQELINAICINSVLLYATFELFICKYNFTEENMGF